MNINAQLYKIENIEDLDSPSLVVFPDLVKYNIDKAVEMVGDISRIRPHIKTHKTAEVIKLCQAFGIEKYKCATIAEAELLAICEAEDVLLAYQPVGKKIDRLIQLIQKYPKTSFSCLIDSYAIAYELSRIGNETYITFKVYIDINTGMNRTGVDTEGALKLAIECQNLVNLKISGFHCYDGNIRDIDFNTRKKDCDASSQKIENLKISLEKEGFLNLNIIIGGSPTFPIHAKRNNVECSPGTFVFWDKGYQESCPEQPFIPAVLAITRIISLPNATRICTDLGHKSISAENDITRRVFFLNANELKFISQSEEHLILEGTEGHNYKIGDVLLGIPIHICPTIALYDSIHVIENERITGQTWKVAARDRSINI
jgi:D-threonine aldolase